VLLAALLAAESVTARNTGTRVDQRSPHPDIPIAAALLAGALVGSVALVRTVGIAIVPAAIVVAAGRRAWRTAGLILLGALVVLAPWQLWVHAHRGELAPILQGQYGTYSAWLGGAIERHGLGFALATARINLGDLVRNCTVQLAPGLPIWCKGVALVAATMLVLAGAVALVRRLPVLAMFAVLYSFEVVFWPFDPLRFVWAVWLLLVLTLAVGAHAALTWNPGHPAARALRGAVLASACVVGAGMLRYEALGFRYHWWATMRDGLSGRTSTVLQWAAGHPRLPELTVTNAAPMLFLYAGQSGVPCNAFTPDEYVVPRDTSRDRAVLSRVLEQFPVGSVITSEPTCALAALRIAAEPTPRLTAIDTMRAGLAVFLRTRYDHSASIATAAH
jgi:hypothetical protein